MSTVSDLFLSRLLKKYMITRAIESYLSKKKSFNGKRRYLSCVMRTECFKYDYIPQRLIFKDMKIVSPKYVTGSEYEPKPVAFQALKQRVCESVSHEKSNCVVCRVKYIKTVRAG